MAQINEIESESESTCDRKINEAHELLVQLEHAASEVPNAEGTEVLRDFPDQLVRLATKVVNKLERALLLVDDVGAMAAYLCCQSSESSGTRLCSACPTRSSSP